MTTREEAKKLAQEYAADNKSSHGCIECEDGGYSSEDDLVKAWMACFDALTKGEPDGWIAYSQRHGFDKTSFRAKEGLVVREIVESFLPGDCPLDAGWRIVPVKILELEGS